VRGEFAAVAFQGKNRFTRRGGSDDKPGPRVASRPANPVSGSWSEERATRVDAFAVSWTGPDLLNNGMFIFRVLSLHPFHRWSPHPEIWFIVPS